MIPTVEVLTLAPATIIAASGDLQYNEGDGTVTGGLHDGEASGDGLVKGRGAGSVWDDDWSN